MANTADVQVYKQEINQLISTWTPRKEKFTAWYDLLNLEDALKREGMESYVSNDPRTFFNMAHFLLTAGTFRHQIPAAGSIATEVDKQSRVERACQYMWRVIDADRQKRGQQPFLAELAFDILGLGWYGLVAQFNKETTLPNIALWSPAETFPKYEDGRMTACVHSYEIDIATAVRKAKGNKWSYTPTQTTGRVRLDDYFFYDENEVLQNIIIIGNDAVIPVTPRTDMILLVGAVGGFPDMGAIKGGGGTDWVKRMGQSILEPNTTVWKALNRWNTFQMQILRDTAQPMWQEHSQGSPKVQPDQIGKRGALFHFSPTEQGLAPIVPSPIPMELRATLMDLNKEAQKGGFPDLLFGITESIRTGYAYDRITNNAAVQALNPYSKVVQFVLSELDRFWLGNLKTSKKVFIIKGRMLENLRPTDIPDDVDVIISTDLPTPKDWLERATVANYLKDILDKTTLLDEVLHVQDANEVKRRRVEDMATDHPASVNVQLIQSFKLYAKYLQDSGFPDQAGDFINAANGLAQQFGIPPAGSARPAEATAAEAASEAGRPEEKFPVSPQVNPPQAQQAFSPEQMRSEFGSGAANQLTPPQQPSAPPVKNRKVKGK